MPGFTLITHRNRERYLRIIEPAGKFLARIGIHPDLVTWIGLFLSLTAGLAYSTGAFFWGAWALALAGACDTLDGHLARLGGGGTRFGAFLDSTLDRYGELAVFLGFAWYFSGGPAFTDGETGTSSPWTVLFVFLAVSGSMMVSYTRARAEGLGAQCREGWMQRPERILLLVIGSLLGALPVVGPFLIKLTFCILAVLAHATALQRIFHVRRQLRRNAGGL